MIDAFGISGGAGGPAQQKRGACKICKQFGHWAANCPNRQEQPKGQAQAMPRAARKRREAMRKSRKPALTATAQATQPIAASKLILSSPRLAGQNASSSLMLTASCVLSKAQEA
jgi:hypothetical protein